MDKRKIFMLLSGIVVVAITILLCSTKTTDAENSEASAIYASNDTRTSAKHSALQITSPLMPKTISLAGEEAPLDIYYVREGLDRELIVNTYGQSSMLLYFKRAYRYFPVIEPILKKNGIPEDFKYLAVIESGLTNATSSAKAQGIWQFMKTTGQNYGLEINDEIDMRNNVEAATEAACHYLKKLHDKFGSWTAAAAAYNCGEGSLSRNFEKQSVTSYYDSRLNAETSRYIYRLLAVKQIMTHPKDYGYYLRPCDLYPTLPYRNVQLKGQNVDLYQFARSNGTTYKMLREMNPWIITDKLTNKSGKTYTVKLPTDEGIKLSKILKEADRSLEYINKM